MTHSSPALRHGLAIDVGGTKVAFALFNELGEVIAERRVLQHDIGQTSPDHSIAQVASRLVTANGMLPLEVVIMGAPGSPRDAVSFTPNTPGFSFPGCMEELKTALGCANVCGLNDVKAAALGEQVWGGWQVNSLLHLNLGTGFAAGAVIDGQLLRGAHELALEVGYLLPIHEEMPSYGALVGQAPTEALLSGAGLARLASQALREADRPGDPGGPQVTAGDVLAAEDGPLHALRERFIEELASVTANLATVLDPEIITLGGGLGAACGPMLPRISERVARFTPFPVPVRIASFAQQAGLLGAIAYGLQVLGAARPLTPPALAQW